MVGNTAIPEASAAVLAAEASDDALAPKTTDVSHVAAY